MQYHRRMPELVFEVVQESDGGYCAECLTENIFTEGDTWEKLGNNVIEATAAFFFDRPRPERIRLHLVRDEILSGRDPSHLSLRIEALEAEARLEYLTGKTEPMSF